MIRYSYMIIDQLSSFGDDDDIRRMLEFIKDCGYEGVEQNLREPTGVGLDRLQKWLGEVGLRGDDLVQGCLGGDDWGVRELGQGRDQLKVAVEAGVGGQGGYAGPIVEH